MEDVIPILIFVIIIFGSAIRKLITYLANQAGTGQDDTRKRKDYQASTDSIRSFLERIEEGPEETRQKQQQARRKARQQRQAQQARQSRQRQESARSESRAQAETSFPEPSQPEFEQPPYGEIQEAEEAASRAREEARKKAKLRKKRRRKKQQAAQKKKTKKGKPPARTVLERLRSARAGEYELKQAIVWYEVLNSPVALRRRPGHQPHVMERPQFGRPRKKEE